MQPSSPRATVIGVAGGSGSGKTTVVRRIVESLVNDQVAVETKKLTDRLGADMKTMSAKLDGITKEMPAPGQLGRDSREVSRH